MILLFADQVAGVFSDFSGSFLHVEAHEFDAKVAEDADWSVCEGGSDQGEAGSVCQELELRSVRVVEVAEKTSKSKPEEEYLIRFVDVLQVKLSPFFIDPEVLLLRWFGIVHIFIFLLDVFLIGT